MTDEERAAKKRATSAAWQRDPANRERLLAWHKRRRKAKPHYAIFAACQKNARRRGHECTLTLERVEELIAPMVCSVTGLPLSTEWDGPDKNPWAPSLDRIDNELGYIEGNVRLVCWAYNLAKGSWPDEVFDKLARSYLELVR
jgi:hypothetical protein